MADTKFPGHDEGTVKPTGAPFVKTPGTYVPLQTEASSVNVKSGLGTTGKG